jgi:hypothetical protein
MVGEKKGKEEERKRTEREICATFVDGLRGVAGMGVWGGKSVRRDDAVGEDAIILGKMRGNGQ